MPIRFACQFLVEVVLVLLAPDPHVAMKRNHVVSAKVVGGCIKMVLVEHLHAPMPVGQARALALHSIVICLPLQGCFLKVGDLVVITIVLLVVLDLEVLEKSARIQAQMSICWRNNRTHSSHDSTHDSSHDSSGKKRIRRIPTMLHLQHLPVHRAHLQFKSMDRSPMV
jgi:hypothetical protein